MTLSPDPVALALADAERLQQTLMVQLLARTWPKARKPFVRRECVCAHSISMHTLPQQGCRRCACQSFTDAALQGISPPPAGKE